MAKSEVWRTVILSSLCELIILTVVAIILMIFFPAYLIYILLGVICVLILYFSIKYLIYKPVFNKPARELRDDLIAQEGVAVTDLAPRGQVKLRNEVWSARTISGTILYGTKVKVVELDGIQLIVEPLQKLNGRA